jgi:hypothetical protein
VNASDSTLDGIFTLTSVGATTVVWSQSGSNASGTVTSDTALLSHALQTEDQNGYVSVYVSDVGGASLSNASIEGIETDLTDRSVGGLIVRVENARVVSVGISVNVTLKSNNLTGSVIEASVKEAIDQYVHPDYWEWGDAVYKNEIIALVDRVAGVDRVVSVTLTNASDYTEKIGDDIVFTYKGLLPLNSTSVAITVP